MVIYLLTKLQKYRKRSQCLHQWANHWFRVFVKCQYSGISFFGETICSMYLHHLFSAYEIEGLGEIYEQLYFHEILCSYSFDDSTECQDLWSWVAISSKTVVIFPMIFSISDRIRLRSSGWYDLPNPSARAGYDTRSIFKRSLVGLNSEFSFS